MQYRSEEKRLYTSFMLSINHAPLSFPKLFVFGGRTATFEVLEDVCGSFVSVKSPKFLYGPSVLEAVAFRGVINIFQSEVPFVACYDVDSEEWVKKPCRTLQTKQRFSCVMVPWFLEIVSI